MKFKNPDSTSKDMLMTEAPSWEALSSVSELTEALMAWQTLDQLIHVYLAIRSEPVFQPSWLEQATQMLRFSARDVGGHQLS